MSTEVLYLGHDNFISMQLKQDGTALTNTQMDAITKITITIDDITVSNVAATKDTGSIRWRQDGYTTGEVRFYLGSSSTISECASPQRAWVIVYTATNTNGIVWGYFSVIVRSDMETS